MHTSLRGANHAAHVALRPRTLSVLPLEVAYKSSVDARRKVPRMIPIWVWWAGAIALVVVVTVIGVTALLFCQWVARVAAGEYEDDET